MLQEERDAARKQEEVLGNALQDSRSALSDIERRLEEDRSMLKQTQDELYKARNQVVIHEVTSPKMCLAYSTVV